MQCASHLATPVDHRSTQIPKIFLSDGTLLARKRLTNAESDKNNEYPMTNDE